MSENKFLNRLAVIKWPLTDGRFIANVKRFLLTDNEIEYLSLEEHEAIIAQKVREARAQTWLEAAIALQEDQESQSIHDYMTMLRKKSEIEQANEAQNFGRSLSGHCPKCKADIGELCNEKCEARK